MVRNHGCKLVFIGYGIIVLIRVALVRTAFSFFFLCLLIIGASILTNLRFTTLYFTICFIALIVYSSVGILTWTQLRDPVTNLFYANTNTVVLPSLLLSYVLAIIISKVLVNSIQNQIKHQKYLQETQDIFGDLAENEVQNQLGLMDQYDGNSKIYQDLFDISDTIIAEAKNDVPEAGREGSSAVRQWEEEELAAAAEQGLSSLGKTGHRPTELYVEDAMPPNNAPFTEGEHFPPNPQHGDYHRVVYTGLSKDVPARLYRYSVAKGRWVFLEKDKRAEHNPAKPTLEEYLISKTRVPHTDISKERP